MSKLFNKKNFETLIETIENYGPEWIDSNLDILDDQWHSGLTHKDPEILRSFGIQCWKKADLMDFLRLLKITQKKRQLIKLLIKLGRI